MDTFAAVWRVAKRFWALTALIILMVVYAILFLFYITRPLIGIHPVSVHSPSRTTSTNTQTSNKGSSVSPVQTGSSSSGATQGSSASNVTTGGTTPTPGMGSGTNSGVNSSVSSNGSSATVCLGPTCVDPSLPNLSSPAPLPTN